MKGNWQKTACKMLVKLTPGSFKLNIYWKMIIIKTVTVFRHLGAKVSRELFLLFETPTKMLLEVKTHILRAKLGFIRHFLTI